MGKGKNPNDSIFKRFGGTLANAVENLIFAHEEVPQEPTAPATAAAGAPDGAAAPAKSGAAAAPAKAADAEKPKVDSKLVNAILESAEELGPALNIYSGYVKTFEEIIPDESSRYKAAFAAAAKVSPLQVDDLLRAADEQIASLKNEKKDFLEGIGEKNSEVDALNEEIKDIDARIEALKEQIKSLETLKMKKEELATNLSANIKKATVRFDAALAAVEQLLREKKARIERNLKGM